MCVCLFLRGPLKIVVFLSVVWFTSLIFQVSARVNIHRRQLRLIQAAVVFMRQQTPWFGSILRIVDKGDDLYNELVKPPEMSPKRRERERERERESCVPLKGATGDLASE